MPSENRGGKEENGGTKITLPARRRTFCFSSFVPLTARVICAINHLRRIGDLRSWRIHPPYEERSLNIDKERFIPFIVMGFAAVLALIPAILYTH